MPLPLYAQCPRCLGGGLVVVITQRGNGFTPTVGEYIQCPTCSGAGEANMDEIIEFAAGENERWSE